MKVTVEKVQSVELIPGDEHFDMVTVAGVKVKVPAAEFDKGYTMLLVNDGSDPYGLPLITLNNVYPQEEMVIGISSFNQGRVMQLGPYEDALVITEGLDVTDLVTKRTKHLFKKIW